MSSSRLSPLSAAALNASIGVSPRRGHRHSVVCTLWPRAELCPTIVHLVTSFFPVLAMHSETDGYFLTLSSFCCGSFPPPACLILPASKYFPLMSSHAISAVASNHSCVSLSSGTFKSSVASPSGFCVITTPRNCTPIASHCF